MTSEEDYSGVEVHRVVMILFVGIAVSLNPSPLTAANCPLRLLLPLDTIVGKLTQSQRVCSTLD